MFQSPSVIIVIIAINIKAISHFVLNLLSFHEELSDSFAFV